MTSCSGTTPSRSTRTPTWTCPSGRPWPSSGLNPGNHKAHTNLGNVLLLRGRREAAIAEYRAAIAIEPGWAESHSNLGMALAMRRDLVEAAAQFGEALRLDPRSVSARSGLNQVLALRHRPPGGNLPPGR